MKKYSLFIAPFAIGLGIRYGNWLLIAIGLCNWTIGVFSDDR